MKKFLDQFRNLNTRDPGAWPPAPKSMLLGGLLIGIVAQGYDADEQTPEQHRLGRGRPRARIAGVEVPELVEKFLHLKSAFGRCGLGRCLACLACLAGL